MTLYPSPLYTLYTCTVYKYTYSHRERGESWNREKVRERERQQFKKLGRKYQHDWMYLQPINSYKHLSQSPFAGKFFLDDDILLWWVNGLEWSRLPTATLRIRKNSLSKGALLGNPSQGFCRPEHIINKHKHCTIYIYMYCIVKKILPLCPTENLILKVWRPLPLFLHFFSFIYTIDTFIHHSFIHKHSLRSISRIFVQFYLLKLHYWTWKYSKMPWMTKIIPRKGRGAGASHHKF